MLAPALRRRRVPPPLLEWGAPSPPRASGRGSRDAADGLIKARKCVKAKTKSSKKLGMTII